MAASQEYLDLLDRVLERVPKLVQEMRELHVEKADGYSGKDNPDTWSNFRGATEYGVSALRGCLVRKQDKIARTQVLLRNYAFEDSRGETIEDTWMDEAAYALIAICLYREEQFVWRERNSLQ
jgi:hypothetical protein